MSTLPLPDYTQLIKTLTRALVEACAAPGQSGQERAAQILGLDRSTISRCGSAAPDNERHLLSLRHLMQLEFVVQQPILAGALAAVTYHHVVAGDDAAPLPDDTALMNDFARVVSATGHLAHEWAEAAADGRFTPAERKNLAEKMLSTAHVLQQEVSRLTVPEGEA